MKSLAILPIFLFSFFLSLFLNSCNEQERGVSKLKLNARAQKIQRTHSLPKLDILFVLEPGLSSYRQELVDHIDELIDPLRDNRLIDFRVGVITSSYFMGNEEEDCGQGGRLLGETNLCEQRNL